MRMPPSPSRRAALLVLVATAAITVPTRAQRVDTTATRTLAPGVTYRRVTDPAGPWVIHVVRVDLRRSDLTLRHARALDSLRGRERTSEMVRRATADGATVLAAVNADFFDLKTGENENNQVIAGEWWKGVKVTDSPYDTYDNTHAQLALDSARHPSIERYQFDGRFWARGGMTPILTLNALPSGTYEGTALFTPRFGATTARDTTKQTAEAPLVVAGRRGDTVLFVRRGAATSSSGSAIPRDGAVLAGYGSRTGGIRALEEGDTVRVLLATLPRSTGRASPALLIGGWPRIVHEGRSVAADAPILEGTISRNAEVRHPRTAAGYSRDRRSLILVVVDGRSTTSVGMTLVELAERLRRLGAWEALNFDGGGSTTMVIDGAVVNTPSDSTGERAVGNALLLLRRR